MDVNKIPEYDGKKIASTLNEINTNTERKNTAIPLFNIFVNKTIIRHRIIIGIKVTMYEIIILIMFSKVKELALKISPDIIEKTIMIIKVINIIIIIALIFTIKSFNLETGLVKHIFIVLLEDSPEKLSIVIRAINRGSSVFINTERTNRGNSVLETPLSPKLFLTTKIKTCPIIINIMDSTATIKTFLFLYNFSNSFIRVALIPVISIYLTYKIIFQGSIIIQYIRSSIYIDKISIIQNTNMCAS